MSLLAHIILGVVAALIGYVIGRLSRAGYISSLENELEEYKSKFTKLEKDYSDQSNELANVKGLYSTVQLERDKLKTSLVDWEKKYELRDQEFHKLEDEIESIKSELTKSNSDWESKLSSWNSERQELTAAHEKEVADWQRKLNDATERKEEV